MNETKKQVYEGYASQRILCDTRPIEEVQQALEAWKGFLENAKESLEIKKIHIQEMEDLVNRLQNRLK